MKFVEFGRQNSNSVLLLHGGGLAPWSFFEIAELLKDRYHVLIPVLDGHNGSDRDFTTIEENARSLITFINEQLGGTVHLIGGLSLGGQILVEMLSQKADICKYAIIESALVLPMRVTAKLIKPTLAFSYPLIKKRWFAKLQSASLSINPSFFEAYYRDSSAISRENMILFLLANADYQLKEDLGKCQAKVLVLVGEKEQRIMKKSAKIIQQLLPNSSLEIMPGFRHGELSMNHPDLYIEKIRQLKEKEEESNDEQKTV